MTSENRALSQIPRNGTYVTTGNLSGAVFSYDETTMTATALNGDDGVPSTAGVILYDMGKTIYLPVAETNKSQVLRKVQVAPFETSLPVSDATVFFIKIGGTGDASPVARM